jgi:hypothetical protein
MVTTLRSLAGYFREKRARFYVSPFWQPTPTLPTGTDLFEVMFSKSRSPGSEYCRVCIELDDNDRARLMSSSSAELGTRAVVRRSGILDLLPAGLEDSWQRFGTVLEENVIGTWLGGSDPIIAKGGHKVWSWNRQQVGDDCSEVAHLIIG